MINLAKLQKELTEDEGCKLEIYRDHLGYPTFGVGHLVKQSDPEWDMDIGTPVSQERVDECFKQDIEMVLTDCVRLFPTFEVMPSEVQLVLANMRFNLGYPRLSKFKKMRAAVEAGDWEEAANQMEDSKWAKTQVPNRAARLVERMRLEAVPF